MDRRDFFKILSTASAGATAGCGSKTDRLIPLLVPEHEIVPGGEQWHPAVCTECAAGCATIARVMEGVRVVERNGQPARERIAAIKKLEGNPLDPVSGGRLCARGQASVQALYHPDRLRGPMRRAGARGQANFAPVAWDAALAQAADAIGKARSGVAFLCGPQTGTRSLAIQRFLESIGAPAPVVCAIADHAVERQAAETILGWKGLPIYDIGRAYYVLGVGADFLGGWTSPVYYARQFGEFRQGRPNVRGRFVQAESRLSLTAAAADRWVPLRPGAEPQFLAAIGRMLGADQFQSADIAACGVEEGRLRQIVEELRQSPAPLVIAGASSIHTNSLDAIAASHYVNAHLGNIGKSGGVLPPAAESPAPAAPRPLAGARVILIDGANPVYTMPPSSGVLQALEHADLVIAFGSFVDDTAAYADLLLPDHHPLESEIAVVPAVSPRPSVAVATPFVAPLYDTRPVEATLADLARRLGAQSPPVSARDLAPGADFDQVAREGGLWPEPAPAAATASPRVAAAALDLAPARFEGDPAQYPFYFQPYTSVQFHDGRGANLPWLQELPDPASSAIWGLPVELDPASAAQLKIATGDLVRVESPHGSLEAPAYVHPGAIPGVVSMPLGEGHTHYGRYASGRGANPLSILAPVFEKSTGRLAIGATRVRLARAGGARHLIQFSAQDREERGFDHR